MSPKAPVMKTYRLVTEITSQESSETKEVQTAPSETEINHPQTASV
jgi:hypothetical protein